MIASIGEAHPASGRVHISADACPAVNNCTRSPPLALLPVSTADACLLLSPILTYPSPSTAGAFLPNRRHGNRRSTDHLPEGRSPPSTDLRLRAPSALRRHHQAVSCISLPVRAARLDYQELQGFTTRDQGSCHRSGRQASLVQGESLPGEQGACPGA